MKLYENYVVGVSIVFGSTVSTNPWYEPKLIWGSCYLIIKGEPGDINGARWFEDARRNVGAETIAGHHNIGLICRVEGFTGAVVHQNVWSPDCGGWDSYVLIEDTGVIIHYSAILNSTFTFSYSDAFQRRLSSVHSWRKKTFIHFNSTDVQDSHQLCEEKLW